jgi:hypothetical protein
MSIDERLDEIEALIAVAVADSADQEVRDGHGRNLYLKVKALHKDERPNFTLEQRDRLHVAAKRLVREVFGMDMDEARAP